MTIDPTGHCFDHALDFLHRRVSADTRLRYSLVLVHGICLVPEDQYQNPDTKPGDPFAHAWVEVPGRREVVDFGFLKAQLIAFTVRRAEYYKFYRVQVSTRYFVDDAIERNRRSGHFGPWEPSYLALCRPRKAASE